MKTTLTLAILLGLLIILAGGVACVLTMPGWVCSLYGVMAAVNVWAALDTIGGIWALKAAR